MVHAAAVIAPFPSPNAWEKASFSHLALAQGVSLAAAKDTHCTLFYFFNLHTLGTLLTIMAEGDRYYSGKVNFEKPHEELKLIPNSVTV